MNPFCVIGQNAARVITASATAIKTETTFLLAVMKLFLSERLFLLIHLDSFGGSCRNVRLAVACRQRMGFLGRFDGFFELACLGKRSVECSKKSRFPVFGKLASA